MCLSLPTIVFATFGGGEACQGLGGGFEDVLL
jgi:hypothetical protein